MTTYRFITMLGRLGQACVWGRCNGTQGSDGRCNRCGSKRP